MQAGAARLLVALCAPVISGCHSPSSTAADAGADGTAAPSQASSNVQHLIVVVQENHTFETHFGRYCTAPTGSSPTCTEGPSCCEAGPAADPSGVLPLLLDDNEHAAFSPNHTQACEVDEIDGGKMDRFITSTVCGDVHNFAYAGQSIVKPYWDLAATGALADRYFQPVAGASSSNDMYLARAHFVFADNAFTLGSIGHQCSLTANTATYTDMTIGDLLDAQSVSWAWYGGGYQAMLTARAQDNCPDPDPGCPAEVAVYPCVYDPSDVPFEYYKSLQDDPKHMKDLSQLAVDLAQGTLPSVSFVKSIGYRSEHPGSGDTLSDGVAFVKGIVAAVMGSPLASSTLLLITYDEGGGYFDHVSPPATSTVDGQPYGTRIPALALGPFARKNQVSHVVMEHSSIVKFIEWNWLGQATGQLHTRDAIVNNLGSLLDPAATGTAVPE
jgi:phospholipase C